MKNSGKHLLVVVCLSAALVIAHLVRQREGATIEAFDQVDLVARISPFSARMPAIEKRKMPRDHGGEPRTSTREREETRSDVGEAFAAFDQWLENYAARVADANAELLEAQGHSLAVRRRSALAELIKSDPQRALSLAVPFKVRRELPASIAENLEERVSGTARFDVIASLPEPEAAEPNSTIERFVTMNDKTYKAFVYGRRVTQTSKEAIPLHGIAIGNAMAVHESPVRILEPGEAADPSLPRASAGGRCPVSQASGHPSVGVEVGREIFYLCSAGHIEAFDETLKLDEAGIGPTHQTSVAASSPGNWSQGTKAILLMRVNFPDDPEESISEADAYDLMRQVNEFFVQNSYGTTTLTASVTPLLTLPREKRWYITDGTDSILLTTLLKDASKAAEAAGFVTSNFELHCVHVKKEVISSSRGYVGRSGAWLYDKNPSIACHEFGHNLGLWHANAWKTMDRSVIGPGSSQEYGNVFDTMGTGRLGQFNACHKRILNWLTDDAIQTITADGVYRLYPFDVPILENGLTYALRIPLDKQRDYWIETRRTGVPGSLLLNWSPWSGSAGGTLLLDTTPGSEGGWYDAPLELGRSFYDPALGLKIIPWALGGTTPESVDVIVKHVHYLNVEAESGALTPPMTVMEDPLASHGQYITSTMIDQGSAAFALEIPTDGEYLLWCRVLANRPGPISLAVSVDGESIAPNAVLEGTGSSDWRWSRIADQSGHYTPKTLPKMFPLMAGSHTFYFRGEIQNVQIDRILVTDDPTAEMPPIPPVVPNQVVMVGTSKVSIPFTVADVSFPASMLKLTASSANPALVSEANIAFGGSNINRTVTITPVPNQVGTASITLKVIQPDGNSSSSTFSLTVIGAVQALINAALPGDTVTIPAGTFIDRVVIDKDLSIQGAGPLETVIDGRKLNVPLTITRDVTVSIRNLTLRNGRGGLRNNGTTTLTQCVIRDNESSENGGGIWNGSSASLLLENCTVSKNKGLGVGGGIYNAGDLSAFNTTLSGNRSSAKYEETGGGAIYNVNTLNAYNCTVSLNSAPHGGGIVNLGNARIGSSIVAGNSADSKESPDFEGELTSAGYNLIQSVNGCVVGGDPIGDIYGQDPRLGPLQDNGGVTWTHALLPDSPAIDQGKAFYLTVDQRGVVRPYDLTNMANAADGCDIGSFEFVPEGGREVRALISSDATPGTIAMKILLRSQGDENAVDFGLTYSPAAFRNPRVTLGTDSLGATFTWDSDADGGGRLRVQLILPDGQAFSAGDRELAVVQFESALETASESLNGIEFDETPGICKILDAAGQQLAAIYRRTSMQMYFRGQLSTRRDSNGEVTVILNNGSGFNWNVQASSDLAIWETVAALTNVTGSAQFTDTAARSYHLRYYRALTY